MKFKILLVIVILTGISGYSLTRPSGQTVQSVQPVLATESVVVPVQEVVPTEKPTIARLLELTNAERAKVGVAPLKLDIRLNRSAQLKADELYREGWDDTPHVSNSGKHGYEYIAENMPSCTYGSENVLGDSITLHSGFTNWMKSKPHREAILDPRYEYIGFGIHERDNSQIRGGTVAAHFCDID